jgi:serine-type D-Ala-D-Ala carboxypeptidase
LKLGNVVSRPLRYGHPEEAGMSSDQVRHVARLAALWVAQGMTPALVVLVARRGVIVLHEAFGWLDTESNLPLPRDAIFPLGSITKAITSATVVALVDDGIIGLNRPITEYLPELVGEGKEAVMVHHLMTHTSGFRDEDIAEHIARKQRAGEIPAPEVSASPLEELYRRFPFVQQLEAANDAALWKPPGVEMSYCEYGYCLLEQIVVRVSGRPLSELARERIFEPLGMADTSYGLPQRLRSRVVRRRLEFGFGEMGTPEFETTTWPFGSAFSTAADMAAFGQMFLDRGRYGQQRLFSAAAVEAMTRNQIPGVAASYRGEFFPEASWSLAWDVRGDKKALRDGSLLSRETFEHGGGGGVCLCIDPVNDIVLAYFSVQIHAGQRIGSPLWRGDLFANAAIAAIEND